jgi:hypothetical protein
MDVLNVYTHSSLLAGLYFAVPQIRRVTPQIKIHHSDPSMHKSIKTVRKLEQLFVPNRTVFKKLMGEKKETAHIKVFLQR